MASSTEKEGAVRELSPKSRRIGWFGAILIRLLSLTMRWRLHDPDDLVGSPPKRPMIWTFWHNRIFVLPTVYHKYLISRKGAVLTSASRDVEIIAALVARFGCDAVRGSSSRRGSAALLGLIEWIRDGYDVAIVPDGPRGPRYRMGPGVIKLAEVTGALILPVRIEYGSSWIFKSWDLFRLPKPFTTVDVYLGPCTEVRSGLDDETFEAERLRVEHLMNPAHETD